MLRWDDLLRELMVIPGTLGYNRMRGGLEIASYVSQASGLSILGEVMNLPSWLPAPNALV